VNRKTIVIATFNQAKAEEIRQLLGSTGFDLRGIREYTGIEPVHEGGMTFAENARLKALAYARQVSGDDVFGVLAEDSGLEVDALGGRPGVFSARYVSEDASDAQRVLRLLEEMSGVAPERRTARFRCHVALARADRVILEAEGVVEGSISMAPAGDFGFGYDPVFVPRGYDRTFAELGASVKHRLSHRAVALGHLREKLTLLLARSGA